MPDPADLCRLMLQQLGRMPTMNELLAALGADSTPGPTEGAIVDPGTNEGHWLGQEGHSEQPHPSGPAGPRDGALTDLLRQEDALSQQLVRMLYLGGGPSVSPTLRVPSRPRQGPWHLRPNRGLSLL